MRLADLENLVNESIKVINEIVKNQVELLKRIEVLEHAHETSNHSDNGNENCGSKLTENGLNPSEP